MAKARESMKDSRHGKAAAKSSAKSTSATSASKGAKVASPKKQKKAPAVPSSQAEAAEAAAAENGVMEPEDSGEEPEEEESEPQDVPVSQAAVARAASTALRELEASKARIAALERELEVLSVQFHFIIYALMATTFDCREKHRSHLPLQESAGGKLVWH